MCGIAGFFSFSENTSIDARHLFEMTQCMAHRGPDDFGHVMIQKDPKQSLFFKKPEHLSTFSSHIGLGHRRLSILDLSDRGRQPMASADGTAWITFNGEIYNYVELAQELKQYGFAFHTGTDTEVVLAAYQKWGTECFKRFIGMWGIAIYDHRKEFLVLSRDRFGKKPLYYHVDSSRILFASEIKALLLDSAITPELNSQKVFDYAARHYRYVDVDNETFFKNIYQVPKAHFMVIKPTGKIQSQRYWAISPDTLASAPSNQSAVVEQFRYILQEAVKIRLRSDVPVGSMLSGGLDSSSVTYLALQHNRSFHAFSGVTGTGYFDESEYIDEIVSHAHLQHTYVRPAAEALIPTISEMLHFHDEPICTVTWYCNYLITKEIAKHKIPVILTGHGGDELLAGYWDHYHYAFCDLRESGMNDSNEVAAWQENHCRNPEEYSKERDYLQRLQIDRSVELQKYSQYLGSLAPAFREKDSKKLLQSNFDKGLIRRLDLELLYETIPPSLRAEDRNMMAFSIENRVPMLDHRLVEYCFSLPNKYKIRQGLGKWVLREAMKGILPEKVRQRKDKTGFNAPMAEWIRGNLRSELQDMIHRKCFVNQEVYSQKEVQKLFDEHCHGANHAMFFWQYINLNLWHNIFFKG